MRPEDFDALTPGYREANGWAVAEIDVGSLINNPEVSGACVLETEVPSQRQQVILQENNDYGCEAS